MRIIAGLILLPMLAAEPAEVAIRGARVVDGSGAPARAATVVIRGGRISAVGPEIPIPAGARIVEAGGQTLIPGLFDLHTHLNASAVTGAAPDWGKHLKAYLACGITTVNDFSVYGEMFAPVRRLLSSGAVEGPRVNLASRVSTPAGHGTEGGWGDFYTLIASTPEQAHAVMKTIIGYHPEVIKIFTDGWRYGTAPNLTSMNLETLTALVEDAHAARLKVFTHTVTLAGAKIAARAGVDVLAHGIGDAVADAELIEILQRKKTAYAPTLAVYQRHTLPAPQLALRLLEPGARDLVSTGAGRTAIAADVREAREVRWKYLLENVRRLHAARIPIATGTDAGMPGTYHGYSALHELELLVEAGLTPLEAIHAGSSTGAQVLGMESERGMIAPGKVADLVLIDGRPDEHIGDIEKVARVFLAGREFEPRQLQAAIQNKDPTPLPAKPIPADIDDMEQPGGRTLLGTLRVNSTDEGTDHSQMIFMPVVRSGHDHALMIEARMAAKAHPFVRLEIPLTAGAVEPGDVSRYTGISFDGRGSGEFRLELLTYGGRKTDVPAAPFSASGAWRNIRIPLAELRCPQGEAPAWNPRAVRSLQFVLTGEPGSAVWLELDNVRLY